MGNLLARHTQHESTSVQLMSNERIQQLRNEISTYEYMIHNMQKTIDYQQQQLNMISTLSHNANEQLVNEYVDKHSNTFLVPDNIERKIIYRFLTYYKEVLQNKLTNQLKHTI